MNRLNFIPRFWLPILAVVFCLGGMVSSCDSKKKPIGQAQAVAPVEDEITKFRKSAEQGDVDGQLNLGRCYEKGTGVAKDAAEAVKWYRMAAEQGNAAAQSSLGYCYADGTGVAKDYVEAAKLWRKAAEQGDAVAQDCLGVCYSNGRGVAKDDLEAIKWYRKAAEQGNDGAQARLGACCQFGDGVPQDYSEAVRWYLKAAEQGHPVAQYLLGCCYDNGTGVAKDASEAAKWYRKAAEQGDDGAQARFGACCQFGDGVPQDYSEAVSWYRKAADQGVARAQRDLGVCYAYGTGVAKDASEAAKWYRKAADQGDSRAQCNLGDFYANGTGVGRDTSEAARWYRAAADQGDSRAQCNLGQCYESGEGVVKGDAEAVKWYRKAAEQGDARAQYNLGVCYDKGLGVIRDEIEAYKWCLLEAAKGYDGEVNSVKILERMGRKISVSSIEQKLSPAQRAEGQHLAREWKPKLAKQEDFPDAPPTTQEAIDKPRFTGTGFLITRNGYLVTNHHVVKNSSKVRVQTSTGLLDAVVVRTDAVSDLALLKVSGAFDALPVVSSRNSRLGSTVATVGFPNVGIQGFEPKLSKGDISSLAGMQDDVKQFQISVPVQPGNSGGALVDERGNVVGVVCAQLSQKAVLESTGTLAQNVNYAVKSIYLLSFLDSVPEVSGRLIEAKMRDQKFEAVVDDVKKATVLIIGY